MTDTKLIIESSPRAAGEARRFVVESAGLDPIRAAEAALLVSEIVSAAVRRSDADLTVAVDRRPGRLEVSVHHDRDLVGELSNDLVTTLFERIAHRHGFDDEGRRAWFEVRPPGTAAALESITDEDLIERAMFDHEAREQVVHRFGSLATSLARRYRGKGVANEDLDQVALFGLLKALSRYQPDRGAFEAFVSATVSGELKRHLRDKAWALRVPRSLQELALEVNRASGILSQRLGRDPTAPEIAMEIDVPEDDVLEARSANAVYWSRSLDMPTSEDETSTVGDGVPDPKVDVEATGAWGAVADAMRRLPVRERTIVYLRFFEDKTQTEIAQIVGVSQMHVSRLLARSLDTLRELNGVE